MMPRKTRPTVDEVLDELRGPRESFRATLTDKDKLLSQMCRYAEREARRKRVPPWSIIGEITDHGSGVASAIYALYRDYPESTNEVKD